MANVKTRAITLEEKTLILETMLKGFTDSTGRVYKSNLKVSTILNLECNLGLRVGDILQLKLSSFKVTNDNIRLDIVEQKTKKEREFLINRNIYNYIMEYAINNGIGKDAKLFDISERQVQRHLKATCEYLSISKVSTHSFRKLYATTIYELNNDIELTRRMLQHSSASITQKYIGISDKLIDDTSVNINML